MCSKSVGITDENKLFKHGQILLGFIRRGVTVGQDHAGAVTFMFVQACSNTGELCFPSFNPGLSRVKARVIFVWSSNSLPSPFETAPSECLTVSHVTDGKLCPQTSGCSEAGDTLVELLFAEHFCAVFSIYHLEYLNKQRSLVCLINHNGMMMPFGLFLVGWEEARKRWKLPRQGHTFKEKKKRLSLTQLPAKLKSSQINPCST